MPAPLDCVAYGTLVARFTALIPAPATTAPLVSVISPLNWAFDDCAFTCGHNIPSTIGTRIPTMELRRCAMCLHFEFIGCRSLQETPDGRERARGNPEVCLETIHILARIRSLCGMAIFLVFYGFQLPGDDGWDFAPDRGLSPDRIDGHGIVSLARTESAQGSSHLLVTKFASPSCSLAWRRTTRNIFESDLRNEKCFRSRALRSSSS